MPAATTKGRTASDRFDDADEIAATFIKNNTLGERIKVVRNIYNYSQTLFAQTIGVSRSYLSEVENEKGKPSIEILVGIATTFYLINANWLLTGEGPIYRDLGGEKLEDGDPIRYIDDGTLLFVFNLLDSHLGHDWLAKQRDPHRKVEIVSFFYTAYQSIFVERRAMAKVTPRMAREAAEARCRTLLERMIAQGVTPGRHRKLEG